MATRRKLIVAELFRYILMSGLSALITVGLPVLLHEALSVEEEPAVAVALATAFVVNFVTLRIYVFASSGKRRKELGRFAVVSAAFRLMEYGIFLVAHNVFGYYYVYAIAAMLMTSALAKFVVYRYFVFFEKAVESTDAG